MDFGVLESPPHGSLMLASLPLTDSIRNGKVLASRSKLGNWARRPCVVDLSTFALPLLIFVAEVCVVTFGTLRIIFVARGKKIIAPARKNC